MARCLTVVFLPLLAALISSLAFGSHEEQCVYTAYVRTGSVLKAGTDARIGLSLGDSGRRHVDIPDLVSWGGLMGPGHDYFERDGLDAFSGRGPCGLQGPICSLNLTSDGAGVHHGWYCKSVEVTTTRPHVPCTQTIFYVDQWLALDAPPYQLYASLDGCDRIRGGEQHRRLVVGAAQTESI